MDDEPEPPSEEPEEVAPPEEPEAAGAVDDAPERLSVR